MASATELRQLHGDVTRDKTDCPRRDYGVRPLNPAPLAATRDPSP